MSSRGLNRAAIVSHAVINLANAYQGKSPDPEKIAAARAALAAAKIEDYIAKTLAAAPPLSAETRQRLARLLSVDGDS